MDSALDGVVTPSRKQVAGIDDDCALDWCRVDKLSCWTLDLEPPSSILEEKSDGSIVLFWGQVVTRRIRRTYAMCTSSNCAWLCFEDIGLNGWIMQ